MQEQIELSGEDEIAQGRKQQEFDHLRFGVPFQYAGNAQPPAREAKPNKHREISLVKLLME